MHSLNAARDRAREGVARLREAVNEEFGDRTDIIVGVNGSYARQEVTPGSDVDIFFLGTGSVEPAREAQEAFSPKLEPLGFKPPSLGGVFQSALPISSLRDNIGGSDDTNITITRRMLFLLEGDWLFNEQGFEQARREIIHAYVRNVAGEGHLCKYFLNDVVRYWRTICVDYEDKARMRDKARGIRHVKLRFSRMLLYFAGVLAAAETYNLTQAQKMAKLHELLAMTPIDRLVHVVGEQAARKPLERYDEFLAALSDSAMRKELDVLGQDFAGTATFQRLRDSARNFRDDLIDVLYGKYGVQHEIIKALVV
jgi:Nucleotidyltransferase domain